VVAQLASDWSKDTSTLGLTLFVNKNACVLVKADVATVLATGVLSGTNDDAANNIALLHRTTWSSLLDSANDDVGKAGVTTLGATKDLDALYAP